MHDRRRGPWPPLLRPCARTCGRALDRFRTALLPGARPPNVCVCIHRTCVRVCVGVVCVCVCVCVCVRVYNIYLSIYLSLSLNLAVGGDRA
jgi:hypothetical protein